MKMKLTLKRILTSVLAGVMLLFSCVFVGCSEKVDDYTVEEHIERISKRMKNRDPDSQYPYGFTYEDFDVYPVYAPTEELVYFLIEFEPCGFMFVRPTDVEKDVISLFFKTSMYQLSFLFSAENPCGVFKTDERGEVVQVLDEKGEEMCFDRSPYFLSNHMADKKYMIENEEAGGAICAVKQDGGFINIINGEKLEFSNTALMNNQERIWFSFIGKPMFEL